MKKYLTLLVSSLVLLPYKPSTGCGFYILSEEYRISLFNEELSTNRELASFTYTTDYLNEFVSDGELETNFSEWKKQLNNSFSLEDFQYAQYALSYDELVENEKVICTENSFLNALLLNKNKEYYTYFKLAKKAEYLSSFTRNDDPWGIGESIDYSKLDIEPSFQNLYKKTSVPFLKERIAFQLCRVGFYYNLNSDEMYTMYFQNTSSTSWLKYSALYFATLRNEKISKEETYKRLIQVFKYAPDKRTACVRYFSDEDRNAVLNTLQTPEEKSIAELIFTIRYAGPALPDLQRIYANNPQNNFIPFALVREVNKIEDWLLTPASTEFEPAIRGLFWSDDTTSELYKTGKNKQQDLAYTSDVILFTKKMYEESYQQNKPLLALVLAHLHFIRSEFEMSKSYLKEVSKCANASAKIKQQAALELFLLEFSEAKKTDEDLQKKLLQVLQNYTAPKNNYEDAFDNLYSYSKADDILLYTGKKCLERNEIPLGVLLIQKSKKAYGEYPVAGYKRGYHVLFDRANPSDYDGLISLLKEKNPTPLITYLKNVTEENYHEEKDSTGKTIYVTDTTMYWSVEKTLDYKSMYYIHENNLDSALLCVQDIPASFWEDKTKPYSYYLTGNPFYLDLGNPHSAYGYSYDSLGNITEYPPIDKTIEYTKPTFLKKLIALKKQAAIEKDKNKKAEMLYLIGNAYYSMTYYGKYWLMSNIAWSVNDPLGSAFFPDKNYYTTSRALPYYVLALKNTTNSKKAALYALYATHCKNNVDAQEHYQKYTDVYSAEPFARNPYIFSKDKKVHQEFYQELLECMQYADFIAPYATL